MGHTVVQFQNRRDAGAQLASKIRERLGEGGSTARNVIVFGLPRGGVPVAHEVARVLGLPLDVIVARKLGFPGHEEVAMGAIGENGVRVFDEELIHLPSVTAQILDETEARERAVLDARVAKLRGDRPHPSLVGTIALIVDDGVATGSTMRAACAVARLWGCANVIAAAPVCPPWAAQSLLADGDANDVVSVLSPRDLVAVGQYYRDFTQVDDADVEALLA